MCTITQWFGRFGNNVLQLAKAIQICENEGIDIIIFPKHELFNSQSIKIEIKNPSNKKIADTFFYTKFTLEPYEIKERCMKYIKPILKVSVSVPDTCDVDLIAHLRSGDIFGNSPHPAYIQPPLSYYRNVINYRPVTIIYEDSKNPCVEELKKLNNVTSYHSTLENDLKMLLSCKEIIAGFGTFCLSVYFLSEKLKVLHLPKEFYDTCPIGNWGSVTVHVHDFPGYIKSGEWKNTKEQRDIILNY